jgi:hypothetical protein
MAKKKAASAADVRVETTENGVVVSAGEKSLSLSKNNVLQLTNEYGNSVTYALDASGFEGLWSELWEFVKDRQH